MPDMPSLTLIKSFDYRGQPEEWSNTYHFSGTTPADFAAWKTLADAVFAEEKKVWSNQTVGVRAYGYEAGNDNAVAVIPYDGITYPSIGGTYAATAADAAPGDCAATVRWWTGAVSSRGKRVYCRKYFHDVYTAGVSNDLVAATQQAVMATLAAKLIDGTLPGSFRYCGPQGA